MLGGVHLPHDRGLAGHSDGDALLHAITDALLGAVAAGDIGGFFPPSDPRWKGADSAVFLREALQQVQRAGYRIVNVDTTVILMTPKIGPHASKIRERLSELLGIPATDIGLKAKTPEGMGTDNAAIAHAVVLLESRRSSERRVMEAAEELPQPVVDEVVEETLKELDPATKSVTKGEFEPE